MSLTFKAIDVQRVRLEKLMKNKDKPVEIPQRQTEAKFADAPEFVRNIMGSSAGAGSGEFHVYRHLRRKEYARQKFIEEQAKTEGKEHEYQLRIETNKQIAEERTAKKRAKRLKKKERKKNKKLKTESNNVKKDVSENEGEEECEEIDVKFPEKVVNHDEKSVDVSNTVATNRDETQVSERGTNT